MSIVQLKNIGEKYRVKFIKEGQITWQEVWAVRDTTLNIDKGEVLGVIGQNGSGKTTLLKLIAGMLIPDSGTITVSGKVSTIMELGAGFNPEFTGRENILVNARIYGLEGAVLKEALTQIVAFADLGEFIDAPIKYYSQGMYMRLAFALAIFVNPDILLIDDILAVGDEEAQQKCLKKIFELRGAGKTIIVVSHDLNMVNKLCDRVILLEKGRVIQDGPSQRVIPYYLETIGDERAIAVVESEGLRVVFNNGRITISYRGIAITKGMAGYVSSYQDNVSTWSPSFNLDWQLKERSPNKITALGANQDGTPAQIWSVGIENNRLRWQIQLKDQPENKSQMHLFLSPEYKVWSDLNQEEELPIFIHKTKWQEIGIEHSPFDSLVLKAGQTDIRPAVLIKVDSGDNQIRLFNSGYEQEARVVQINAGNNRIGMTIAFYSSPEECNTYIQETRQQLRKQEEGKRQQRLASSTITSGPLRLFADEEHKALRLFYNDTEITTGNALHGSFRISQEHLWAMFRDAQWKVEKNSESELLVRLQYESLLQVWKFTFNQNDTLEFSIELEINNPVCLANHDVRIEVKDRYARWFTTSEKGDFLASQYINNIAPVRLKESKVTGAGLESNKENDTPGLLFETAFPMARQILGIYKYRYPHEDSVYLNFSLIIPKKEERIVSGRHLYFKGKIALERKPGFSKERPVTKGVGIKSGNLEFVFEQGAGKLFFAGKELTTGLGMYTSIRSLGTWYDSYQSTWDLISTISNKIITCGNWPYIPISQYWEVELLDDKSIRWTVDMEVYDEIYFEIEQTNLMLIPEYRQWIIAGLQKGDFPGDYTKDYDILPFRFWYGKFRKEGMQAIGSGLPPVLFTSSIEEGSLRMIVENTDYIYKGRLLQYQKCNTNKLPLKRYRYFTGVIRVES